VHNFINRTAVLYAKIGLSAIYFSFKGRGSKQNKMPWSHCSQCPTPAVYHNTFLYPSLGSHIHLLDIPILSKDSIMAKKALSECVKSQKQSKLKEKKILEAVEAYRAEQAKPGTQKGVHTISKEHGIEKCYKIIINRYHNMWSTAEAHEDQQKLTVAEQSVLVDFLMQSADHGFPQSQCNITQYANLICNNQLGKDCMQIRDTWVGCKG
jgi:hypothetical protein